MKQLSTGSFRFNPIIALGLLGIIVIPIVLFMLGKSPEAAAKEFMAALAAGDVDTLTEMTYLPDPESDIKEQWQETFETTAKNYVFGWQFGTTEKDRDDRAVVRVIVTEFRGPETHENDQANIPLIRKDDKWMVDMRSLSRTFFPGLPR
jgi:hypothetical protein